jgi:hypothetical protein
VGYHCSFPLTLDSSDALSYHHRGIPHLAKNERDMGHGGFRIQVQHFHKRR